MTNLPSGLATSDYSTTIRPQDDLFGYVHERWIERTEIPKDKSKWGSFAILAEQAEEAVRSIVVEMQNAEPGTEERKAGDLYASFLNEAAADEQGIDPIRGMLEEVDSAESIDALLAVIAAMEAGGGPKFIDQWVDNDPGDPSRYIVMFEQGGLGMPDESYYREASFADTREEYLAYLATMFSHIGPPVSRASVEPDAEAAVVFALESEIAQLHWDRVSSRDEEKIYNLRQPAAEYPFLSPWLDAIRAPGAVYDEVVVREPSFFEGLASVLIEERLDEWKSWARAGIIRAYAPYLSAKISRDQFDFYGRVLTGATEQRERWKRGVSLVEALLSDVVGRVYAERHFPPEAKATMDALIERLVAAYGASIRELEWMSGTTRERALEKLSQFTPKVGYPNRWKTYEAVEIGDDLVANVRSASTAEHDRELKKIGRPVNRDEWFMGPQAVNAYYNPGFNEIVFPAAILQPPFFDPQRDPAANYGAIGAVIGHEIGHGFDDQGSKYDGEGRLQTWWTEEDRAAFELRTSSLIAQYDALEPLAAPGHKVNGALTVGENIGDIGGVGIAWKAYVDSLEGSEPPVIDGFTGAQRFFLAWAETWQIKIREEEATRLVSVDPHSPNEHRTNQVVRNIDAFAEAFGVQPGDTLWLDPEARVTIW